MSASDERPDIEMQLASGPSDLPGIRMVMVSRNVWGEGYVTGERQSTEESWAALRTLEGAGRLFFRDRPDERLVRRQHGKCHGSITAQGSRVDQDRGHPTGRERCQGDILDEPAEPIATHSSD